MLVLTGMDLWVSGTGLDRVGGASRPEFWTTVEVAPQPGDQDAPWRLTTLARRGCRPGGNGGWSADSGLPDIAGSAVEGVLLSSAPVGAPRDELHLLMESAHDVGQRAGAALSDPAVWAPGVLDVDGHRFMLWVHHRDEGFAAVADLGPVMVSAHGRTPPSRWAGSLLDPAAARRLLR
ncbi:hypothetical protein [Modestobacter sp. VKM Ac-2977]|uniref:hypothetical protein n=1 Tax=Modestobacter sp. VKM Ac-2977 TaxID=3004131 RepID=UPI0022AA9942|nr:hypothetical protein [Modestobacter sp. VKM Ac-2977]